MTEHHATALVIGSGPGGATTATMLAEAGWDVLLVEEGAHHSIDSAPSYSLEEMEQKYRNGGLTPAFGKTKVTYIEGRCVGGASEINAALYHRPKPERLRDWGLSYQVDGISMSELEPHFEAVEADFSVSGRPDAFAPAAKALVQGAKELGWTANEIKRFWKYTQQVDGTVSGRRQSMTEVMIPRFLAAGGRLMPNTRMRKLVLEGDRAVAAEGVQTEAGRARKVRIRFDRVFVCCGAVQTPALLRRSGIKRNVGDNLKMHPMVRIAARFDRPVNDPHFGVPVQQVEQFKPLMTLGCSHSSLPHLALWLAGDVADKQAKLAAWDHMAVFYVAVTGAAKGTVRSLPVLDEVLVRYPLGDADLGLLGEGLYRLGQLVFAAGAVEVINPIEGGRSIFSPNDLRQIRTGLPHGKVNVTSIHQFCSCPMGEDTRRCAVDSYGRAHGLQNVHLHDASIFPDTPGVNPQGTVLALARRNTARLLG